MSEYYLGLISGTSADGIDAILVELAEHSVVTLAAETFAYPDDVRQEILSISQPAADHGEQRIDRLGHLDHQVGSLFADAAKTLCAKANVDISKVSAIGSHGQTVRHRPQGSHHFTLQIGDANVIAFETGVTTVSDFRRMDIAAGGQGAPLVPLFHQWLLGESDKNRAILNLGGIANLSWLPKHKGQVIGFDTGPANALCDYWIQQQLAKNYDKQGEWAKSGTVSEELLKHMMADPYFLMSAPKSTGREYFDAKWLEQKLKGADPIAAEDTQATLVELTARTVTDHIQRLPAQCDELLVCGGGYHNDFLMARIAQHLPNQTKIQPLNALGVDSDFIEAATFAWLAKQRCERQPQNYTSITGASRPVIMGALYQA
ncbi:anhydro-N-acetylmuramic acid kinase [Pleionea mediterranea]|uniref:Anhydro-N-acetylmuramic acid kinase n=1 Tax=Pleionea mediterranea TaxID=523701 RepID=A0A316FAQ1_9GAMM|nr:anhydro-N-acetylmuramic acid kinase [Pleionea mediterranea]PWK45402.1 anhydro-N-acetylmuramic acid kinase [Pleionea mediterranea]